MKIIGLTGGIGTGKSTVSEYLASKDCIILDADKISRNMTRKGATALAEIAEVFGKHLIDEEGNLNRQALGNIVFKDKEKLKKLEEIITKKVVEDINYKLNTLKEQNCDLLIEENKKLVSEIGRLSSSERIEKIAVSEYGMRLAESDEIIRVEVGKK